MTATSVCASILMASCGDPVAPDPWHGQRPIVFVGRSWQPSVGIGDPMLYVMRPDGSGLRRLTARTGQELHPAWSRDGRQIAFSTGPEVWLVAADGGDARRVAGFPACMYWYSRISWSPDGTRLVAQCMLDVYVVSLSDDQAYSLSSRIAGDVEYPDWSPNGDRIAYSAGVFAGDSIRTVRPDGTDVQPLLTRAEEVSWSPDGKRLAFVAVQDTMRTLFISAADGSGRQRLLNPHEEKIGEIYGPAWSLDGNWLTFQATTVLCKQVGSPPSETCDLHWGVYVIRTDGRHLRKITPESLQSGRPSW